MATIHVYECWFILALVLTPPTIADEKRLLLHSQDDIFAVIASLQTEVAALKTNVRALETINTTLQTEVQTLQVKVKTLENINTTLQTEVQTLSDKVKILETINTTAVQNSKDVDSLQAKVKALKTPSGSDVYVRWGRTSCPPNGTEFVYKGYMAGSHWNEYGGGSNNLCLPEDPTWDQYVDGYSGGATIYGTEMEIQAAVSTALFGKQTLNQDIPCAVCRTSASSLMLPARASCYPGWTVEYSGYLVGGHPTLKSQVDYVCLDSGFEFVPHGAENDETHVVYPVEVKCGSLGGLPCPPYVQDRELACVVCSKI